MHLELEALENNDTRQLVPKTSGVSVIGSKWVYKTNLRYDDSIERLMHILWHKVILKLLGSILMKHSTPIIKPTTVRVIHSIAVTRKWPIHQLDFKKAFFTWISKRNCSTTWFKI